MSYMLYTRKKLILINVSIVLTEIFGRWFPNYAVTALFRDSTIQRQFAVSFCRGIVRWTNYSATIFCQSFEC